MTDKQINIAIAEACGIAGEDKWGSLYHTDRGYVRDCPDFCKDLNAMHEAEMGLSSVKAAEYARILTSMAWQSEQPVFAPMTATASQRAEAFLRTLNLWKE